MHNVEKILTILTFIVLLACQILVLRSTTKKYYGTSIQGFSSYKIHSIIRLFTPCYIASRDYFRRDDILYKRTNFRVINNSDISNPNPKKFVKGIIRGSAKQYYQMLKLLIIISNLKQQAILIC